VAELVQYNKFTIDNPSLGNIGTTSPAVGFYELNQISVTDTRNINIQQVFLDSDKLLQFKSTMT